MENEIQFGKRKKCGVELVELQHDFKLAREIFLQGRFFEAFDIFEQMIVAYPDQAVEILAEVYDHYQRLPQKDRYHLYQARHFQFGIKPSDTVLDIGSGHLPFSLATHLTDISFDKNEYGRGGNPFKHIAGKPSFECDIENMQFADKEFDFVYCSHVLEHVRNPEKACKEIIRIGKRGYIETPTKGKDIFFNNIKYSNHCWAIEKFQDSLIFTEYTEDEVEALQCDVLLKMHCSPETKREKAFSALVYLKADLMNTMLLWQSDFCYQIRRLNA